LEQERYNLQDIQAAISKVSPDHHKREVKKLTFQLEQERYNLQDIQAAISKVSPDLHKVGGREVNLLIGPGEIKKKVEAQKMKKKVTSAEKL
jgi:hypothetical protein